MKNSKREEIISHSAKKLFNIVLDIESYPEYIPWCTKMVVNEKKIMKFLLICMLNINLF